MFLKLFCVLVLVTGLHPICFADSIGNILPDHTILTVLPSQPIAGARLVYWDQAAADALRLALPPGRVGTPEFETAVVKMMAYEIKQNPKPLTPNEVSTTVDENHQPYFFVEEDAHGGSGRAGFIEIAPGVVVNVKGIGSTGLRGLPLGPPNDTFVSHVDGSATLEESFKEAIYGRMVDAEMKAGGSRVLAILSTNRTIRYENGNEVPLAIIVRVPVQRYDQAKRLKIANANSILESLAQANTMRILKGDFVNRSNMGGSGEFVDYGCITHIGDYTPAHSAEDAELFFETSYLFGKKGDYEKKIGKYLLNQMGIPESWITNSKNIQNLGFDFIDLTYAKKGLKIDFDQVSEAQLEEGFNLHGWLADLSANYFASPGISKSAYVEREWNRAISQKYLTNVQNPKFEKFGKRFLESLYQSLTEIPAPAAAADRVAYAEKIRQISRFKNRDIQDLVRPVLFQKAAQLARDFNQNHDATKVQYVIDEIVLSNRLGTSAGAEDNLLVRANAQATEISFRAFRDGNGSVKLFQYPELRGASDGESFRFRTTTDSWKTYQDLEAKFVQTSHGDYLRISIPHGSMAVTDARVEFTPFVENKSHETIWLKDNFHLQGPPLLLNERLGLAANFSRWEGYYHLQTNLEKDDQPLQTKMTNLNCNQILKGK